MHKHPITISLKDGAHIVTWAEPKSFHTTLLRVWAIAYISGSYYRVWKWKWAVLFNVRYNTGTKNQSKVQTDDIPDDYNELIQAMTKEKTMLPQ